MQNSDNIREYYTRHATAYAEKTLEMEMLSIQQVFLDMLPKAAKVLDVGCGPGRDIQFFTSSGCTVFGLDFVPEFVDMAQHHTTSQVKLGDFRAIMEIGMYHGIWACASLLHLDTLQLVQTLKRLLAALVPNGIVYMSFKHGSAMCTRGQRQFYDLNSTRLSILLKLLPKVDIVREWQSHDVRKDTNFEWYNVILRKA